MLKRPTWGQSLVETAVIAPILIFMMLGVFEVGWALRGYLVLVNVNRETTRFAVRPGYLDFSQKDPEQVGYNSVLTQAHASLGINETEQLPLDFNSNSVLIISHLVVDTGRPCDPALDVSLCDCDAFLDEGSNYNQAQNFTYDDLILTPNIPGYEYYARSFPTNTLALSQTNFLTTTSAISYTAEVARLARQNNKFNCELMKKGGIPSANNMIITELSYEQPQLFGFPLISNPFTDPVPLYTRTSMRIVAGARSGNNADTVGPVCEVYPWYVTDTLTTVPQNMVTDGWVKWNSSPTLFNSPVSNEAYLAYSLRYPRMAINDYRNPADPSDPYVAVGKQVGLYSLNPSPDDQVFMAELSGREIIIPVINPGLQTIVDFIKVTVTDGVDVGNGQINVIYNGESAVGIDCLGP
jgi:hypothetical protein